MSKYSLNPQLYNPSPPLGKHDARGWKTLNGAINEAKELTSCLMANAFLWGGPAGYSWFVTVYVHRTLNEQEVQALWTHVADNLGESGLVAFWKREVTPTDRVHYHLAIVGEMKKNDLKELIRRAFPKAYRPTNQRRLFTICPDSADNYKDTAVCCSYIAKKRIAGVLKKGKNRGLMVNDIYKHKRHLFQSHVKLRTTGAIGPFWKKKRKDIWQDVIVHERALAAERTPDLVRYAGEIAPSLGEGVTVDGVIRHLCEVELAAKKKGRILHNGETAALPSEPSC